MSIIERLELIENIDSVKLCLLKTYFMGWILVKLQWHKGIKEELKNGIKRLKLLLKKQSYEKNKIK